MIQSFEWSCQSVFHHWFFTYLWILRFVLCSTRDNSLSVPAGSRWQGFQINYFGWKNNCLCAAAASASTFRAHFCYFFFFSRSVLALHRAENWLTWERLLSMWLPFCFAVICSHHCERVSGIVAARQAHCVQSDRTINCRSGSEI